MSKRGSLALIGMIYVTVIAISFLFYEYVQINSVLIKLLITDILATMLIWVLSLVLKNASLYDPYWSVIPPFLILLLMYEYSNFELNMILLLIAVSLWAIRLTYNWAKLWSDFKHQDWRYENIGDFAPKLYLITSFLGIMLFPTLIVFAQHIGILKLASIKHVASYGTYLGFIIILVATLIQFLSDSQMQNFKKNQTDKTKLINVGLWKYSRHPNYLGEILMWWGVYLFYADAYGLNLYILAPLLMTAMFLFISIPLLERKILKTRPHYRVYQKEVSMLIPFKSFKIGTQDYDAEK